MSSKTIREKRDGSSTADAWHAPPETAPSELRDDVSTLGWSVGTFGLTFLVLGILTLLINYSGSQSAFVSAVTAVMGVGRATFAVVLGLVLLLFHAATDKSLQVRRTYAIFGFAWLGTAALLFLLLATRGVSGNLFGSGFVCLGIALLFVLASLRNETDVLWRTRSVLVVGGVGLVLALVGFIGSNVGQGAFLLPYGVLLALMGLAYLWAYAAMVGTDTGFGYRVGIGIGILGAAVFLVALVRTVLPQLFFSWGWLSPAPPVPYFVPTGLLLMALGALYAFLSMALCSDNRFVVMTQRELASLFYSPIAYIVLFGITFVAWILFMLFVNRLADPRAGILEPIVQQYIIQWWPIICVIFVVPVLTMRLLSEEHRTGTLEVLSTAPVGETSIVLSKFVAVWIFFMLLWIPWALFLVALRVWGQQPFDYRPLLSFFIALACTGAAFLSMGVFFSSLFRSQIASAVLTFIGMLALTMVFFVKMIINSELPGNAWIPVLKHISYVDLWIESLTGLLLPQLLLGWLSITVLWLFMTVKVLEARRWS